MGLNDNFFTLPTQTEEEEQTRVASVKVFAPSAPGQIPDLLNDVEFIAVPDQEIAQTTAALETICVGLRDIELFGQQLRSVGGISMGMALESMDYLPGLITEAIPKEYYTQHPSRTMYTHALEQEEEQSKSLLVRALELVRAFFKKIKNWFVEKLAHLTGKDKIEAAAKREEELKLKFKESEERLAKIAEDYDQLRRASAGDLESYKAQITTMGKRVRELENENASANANAQSAQAVAAVNRTAALNAQAGENNANKAAAATTQENADLQTRLRDLQSQMRNLDDTKSKEIAELLDRLEATQRKSANSRAARIEQVAQHDELKLVVAKVITKTMSDAMNNARGELFESYSEFARSRILANKLVTKYMLGSGLNRRVQMIQKTTDYLDSGALITNHVKQLREALAKIDTDPSLMSNAIRSFNPSQVQDLELIFEKSEPSPDEIAKLPAARLAGFLQEMLDAAEVGRKKVATVDFTALQKELEEMDKMLSADNSLRVDYKFVNPVVNAYRELQGHIAKLLPSISKVAQVANELTNLATAIVGSQAAHGAFLSSDIFTAFCDKLLKGVCEHVGVSTSFLTAGDTEVRGHAISVLFQNVQQS